MKNAFAIFLLMVFTAAIGFAQSGKPVTLKGFVIDQMCAKGMAKKDNFKQKAPEHSKECALEDGCAASGYGIYSDGKWYKFDEKGSEKAKAMIEKSSREKALYFEATGKIDGETFTVASLKESSLEKQTGKETKKG